MAFYLSNWSRREVVVSDPNLVETLPVLPLKNTVLFPYLLLPLSVDRPFSIAAVEAALAREDKELVVVAQRNTSVDVPLQSDLYTIGTKAVVKKKGNQEHGSLEAILLGIERSVIVSDTDEFTVDESWLSARPQVDGRHGLSGALATQERAMVEDALRASGGRVFGPAGAAARLGIPRSTLESKIRALKIDKGRFRIRTPKIS